MALESSPRHPWLARLALWAGAFFLPFLLAGLALLLPATQRTICNLLLADLFPGGRAATARFGLQGLALADVHLPVSGGHLEIRQVTLSGRWWQLLWQDYVDLHQLRFNHVQFFPGLVSSSLGASRSFDVAVDGSVQDFPAEPRRYFGRWHIQAAPALPASSLPLSGSLVLRTRDPLGQGVQPFAEAEYAGALDAGFLWNLSPSSLAAHDQVARFFALLPMGANRQAAALRLMDSPGQYWKIQVGFSGTPGTGLTWEVHAQLWGDADLAADFATLNLVTRTASGAPVTDASGYTEGPTLVVGGVGNTPTSTNFAQILLQMRQ